MTKIKCPQCGTYFDSPFCPQCGMKRLEEYQASVVENVENKAELQKGCGVLHVLYVLLRAAVAIFLMLFMLALLLTGGWISSLLIFVCVFMIIPAFSGIKSKIYSIFPFTISVWVKIIFVIVLVIASLFAMPMSEIDESGDGKTEASHKLETSKEDQSNVNMFSKREHKRINKIEKAIQNGEFEKAEKLMNENDFGDSENALLREEYYIAQDNIDEAAEVLISYCRELERLEEANDDLRYEELLSLKDKAPQKEHEITMLEHDVNVATLGENGHTWADATCETAKTCELCGDTLGDIPGHKWTEATCIEASKCSVCEKVNGEPLGHECNEWTMVTDSTCSEEGKEISVCDLCGEEVERTIDRKEHTPGEWEISSPATDTTSGKRRKICKVCDEVVEIEPYSLSAEEKKEYYKNNCQSVSYDDLIRNPDTYKGVPIKIKVRINSVEKVDSFLFEDQYEATAGGQTLSVIDERADKQPKFRAGDSVTIYGVGKGYNTLYTYRTGLILGIPRDIKSEKVPCVGVKYATIN